MTSESWCLSHNELSTRKSETSAISRPATKSEISHNSLVGDDSPSGFDSSPYIVSKYEAMHYYVTFSRDKTSTMSRLNTASPSVSSRLVLMFFAPFPTSTPPWTFAVPLLLLLDYPSLPLRHGNMVPVYKAQIRGSERRLRRSRLQRREGVSGSAGGDDTSNQEP